MLLEQLAHAQEIVIFQRVIGQVHVCGVEVLPIGQRLGLRALGLALRALGLALCLLTEAPGANGLPGAGHDAQNQRQRHKRRCGEGEPVPLSQFLDPVKRARRTRDHRLVIEVPLNVGGQTVGRFVSARAILFQTLHHDPVQVAAHQVNQPGRFRVPMFGHRR